MKLYPQEMIVLASFAVADQLKNSLFCCSSPTKPQYSNKSSWKDTCFAHWTTRFGLLENVVCKCNFFQGFQDKFLKNQMINAF